MGRIEIVPMERGIVYRLVGQGHTGEVFEDLPEAGIPETIAHLLGLSATGYGGDGMPCAFTRYVLGVDCVAVPIPEARDTRPALLRLDVVMRGDTAFVAARDGTVRRVCDDWRLDVLPEAVKQCHLELRQDFIERKEPATTKAAFSEDAHNRATMVIERASRGKGGKVESKPFPRPVPPVRGRV